MSLFVKRYPHHRKEPENLSRVARQIKERRDDRSGAGEEQGIEFPRAGTLLFLNAIVSFSVQNAFVMVILTRGFFEKKTITRIFAKF